jgi:hypothetical protein
MFGQLKGKGLDGQRFDALSRLVATGMPRRKVLGMIGGGLAAIVSRVTSVSAGCLGEGSPCLDDITCCPGLFCDLGAVAGTGTLGGGVCTPDIQCKVDGETCGILPATVVQADCCDGLLCIGNVCTTPAPVCSLVGESCSLVQGILPSCCDGLVCMDGTCVVPAPACAVEGEACSMAEGAPLLECCDGLVCIEGICAVPEPTCGIEGDACSLDQGAEGPCCDGLVCSEDGFCVVPGPTCQPEGEICEVDGDCCEGICCAGACRAIECCIDDPNPNDRCADGQTCNEGICAGVSTGCTSDAECGTGTCCCDDGSCSADCCPPAPEVDPVTDLPNTGIGIGNGGASGWFGAAIVGAAAAFLGGKKLRGEPKPTEPAE